jgi:hypothetical protein
MEKDNEVRESYVEFVGQLLHKMSLRSLKIMLDVALKLIEE